MAQRDARRLADSAQKAASAKAQLRKDVERAFEGGMSVAQIAEIVGVTRQTIYAWIGLR